MYLSTLSFVEENEIICFHIFQHSITNYHTRTSFKNVSIRLQWNFKTIFYIMMVDLKIHYNREPVTDCR